MRHAAALLVAAGCTSSGPRLDTVTPDLAAPGAVVQLTGRGFCGSSDDCDTVTAQVELGVNPPYFQAEVMSWAATGAQVVVPETPSGSTSIVIDVNDQASNSLAFVVEGGN